MIVLRTHPAHIPRVVELSLHALHAKPRIARGERVLISRLAGFPDGRPAVQYVMDFVAYRPGTEEARRIWGRDWRYIMEGRNCRVLKRPFNLRQVQVSSRNYGQGGPFVYVHPDDELELDRRGLLA